MYTLENRCFVFMNACNNFAQYLTSVKFVSIIILSFSVSSFKIGINLFVKYTVITICLQLQSVNLLNFCLENITPFRGTK